MLQSYELCCAWVVIYSMQAYGLCSAWVLTYFDPVLLEFWPTSILFSSNSDLLRSCSAWVLTYFDPVLLPLDVSYPVDRTLEISCLLKFWSTSILSVVPWTSACLPQSYRSASCECSQTAIVSPPPALPLPSPHPFVSGLVSVVCGIPQNWVICT